MTAGTTAPRNPLGIVGLCVALVGLLSLAALSVLYALEFPWLRGLRAWQVIACGALSPLGLLLSAVGVFRIPKGPATGGVVLGMLGTLYLAGAGTLLVANEMELFTPPAELEKRREARSIAAVEKAAEIIRQHVLSSGAAPDEETGSRLIAGFVDGWGRSIHYLPDREKGVKEFLIICAGPDGEFGNSDDITNKTLDTQRQREADEQIENFLDGASFGPP